MGQEDCLYINVYIPGREIIPDRKMDVIVHIHGGAFLLGSPSFIAGPNYIMDKDVIYVNFNYRLGILGFLSTEDNVIPGNNGLKDQVLALRWIQENIQYFGGNPDSVTITGLSAGGASVHYHYFSPMSKKLFNRGLSMSGTALNHWALVSQPSENARKLAASHKCPEMPTELLQCLQEIPYRDIVKSLNEFMVFLGVVPFAPFGPVIERNNTENEPFLSEHPYKLLLEGNFHQKPWICGNVKDEGIFPVGWYTMMKRLHEFDEGWNEIMPYAIDLNNRVDDKDIPYVVKKIRKYYIEEGPVSMDNIQKLVDMFSDRSFTIDAQKAAVLQAKVAKEPVYYYKFSYHLQQFGLLANLNSTAHCDDSRLLFNTMAAPESLTPDDKTMKDIMLDFLYSYAKTGTPTINKSKWEPISNTKNKFMEILSIRDIYMTTMNRHKNLDFWEELPIKENSKLFS